MSYATLDYGSLVFGIIRDNEIVNKESKWNDKCPSKNSWNNLPTMETMWLENNINSNDWDNKSPSVINTNKCKE